MLAEVDVEVGGDGGDGGGAAGRHRIGALAGVVAERVGCRRRRVEGDERALDVVHGATSARGRVGIPEPLGQGVEQLHGGFGIGLKAGSVVGQLQRDAVGVDDVGRLAPAVVELDDLVVAGRLAALDDLGDVFGRRADRDVVRPLRQAEARGYVGASLVALSDAVQLEEGQAATVAGPDVVEGVTHEAGSEAVDLRVEKLETDQLAVEAVVFLDVLTGDGNVMESGSVHGDEYTRGVLIACAHASRGEGTPMNLLLFSAQDLDGERLVLRDDRVRHIRKVLRKDIGDEIRVGAIDGLVGTGRIVHLDDDRAELTVRLDTESPPTLGVDLVLALPRPKFVGRILQAVASMGVDRLTLLQTARVQKSYWQSSVVDPGSIMRHLRLGLEQGAATTLPIVEIRKEFRSFVEEELAPRLEHSPGLLADGSGREAFPRQVVGPHTLIVGPEGGFVDDDLAALTEAGARVVSLGRRILKVEVAVAVCLSRCLPSDG